MPRILVVADDDLEFQALNRELGARFELVRANGREQAMALLDKFPDVLALVAYWGALGSGPEVMRFAAKKRPQVARVLISARREAEAQSLVDSGVVRAVVDNPAAALAALGTRPAAAPAPAQHPLRAEPRTVVKVQVPVSTPAWQGFQALWTKDVSRGGAFFFYAQRVVPTLGAPCKVQLGGTAIEAVVAHVMTARLATATGAEAGFGVTFAPQQPSEWWVPMQRAQQPAAPPTPSAARAAAPTAKELESAKNFYTLAMSLYDQKNYGAARQKLELADRVAPNPKYEAMQAVCSGQQHLRMGLLEPARDAFARALVLDPSCEQATAGLRDLASKKK